MSTDTKTCPKCGGAVPADAPQGLCPACVLAGAATQTEHGIIPSASEDVPSLTRVAAAFPQLEILELVGRGGMGFVYKARQPHLDRLVALKLLPDKLACQPQFSERFNREGRVLAKLSHPNIVSVYDFGQTTDFYFLLMEFVDGVNLRQAMRAGRFSPAEALGIVPKICEALQYAHEQGILHRDIKPENILLDTKGRVKIADFGIAKLVGEDPHLVTLTGTGAALGTPHYMAPEQLEKPNSVDHRADIYSLGVVFYEMLTGELPIGRFAPPSARTPVSPGVDEVVFRALEKDPERRFQSAGQVKTEVEQLAPSAVGSGGANPPPRHAAGPGAHGPEHRPEKARMSGKAIAGAALAGLGLMMIGLPLLLTIGTRSGLGWVELLLIGVPGALFALAGTILGWWALVDIQAGRGLVRGLPLALFAGLAWPLLVLLGVLVGGPALTLAQRVEVREGGVQYSRPVWSLFAWRSLALVVPAGAVTFAIWAVYATARWASGGSAHESSGRRGVLKWVFALLVIGMGFLLPGGFRNALPEEGRVRAGAPGPQVHFGGPADLRESAATDGWTLLTFHSVDIKEVPDAFWLSIEYAGEQHGECRLSFRTEGPQIRRSPTEIRGSTHQEDRLGQPPLIIERVELLLPNGFTRAEAETVRRSFERRWIGKPLVVQPGAEYQLIDFHVEGRGRVQLFVTGSS
jgi:predicted Ser/Thr protein kinase